jgi:hypothetical protein
MRRLATGTMMVVAMLGLSAGVARGTMGHPSQAAETEPFSPLFAHRLAIGSDGLDQPAERVQPSLLAAQRVEIIASGTPVSYCIGSVCIGSTCLGSACLGSTCFGSACGNSGCAGSVCVGSTCLGSACVGSKCVGSACSACGAEKPVPVDEA